MNYQEYTHLEQKTLNIMRLLSNLPQDTEFSLKLSLNDKTFCINTTQEAKETQDSILEELSKAKARLKLTKFKVTLDDGVNYDYVTVMAKTEKDAFDEANSQCQFWYNFNQATIKELK